MSTKRISVSLGMRRQRLSSTFCCPVLFKSVCCVVFVVCWVGAICVFFPLHDFWCASLPAFPVKYFSHFGHSSTLFGVEIACGRMIPSWDARRCPANQFLFSPCWVLAQIGQWFGGGRGQMKWKRPVGSKFS
eukprot:Lithocolla_globosa_v1_NODE_1439_length_2574_cov_13.629218.p2 type:complete len:132 gc:universal NODE_1439_length_2574_cov_13.629218:936-541(-)